jgi:hypothetical protein
MPMPTLIALRPASVSSTDCVLQRTEAEPVVAFRSGIAISRDDKVQAQNLRPSLHQRLTAALAAESTGGTVAGAGKLYRQQRAHARI